MILAFIQQVPVVESVARPRCCFVCSTNDSFGFGRSCWEEQGEVGRHEPGSQLGNELEILLYLPGRIRFDLVRFGGSYCKYHKLPNER